MQLRILYFFLFIPFLITADPLVDKVAFKIKKMHKAGQITDQQAQDTSSELVSKLKNAKKSDDPNKLIKASLESIELEDKAHPTTDSTIKATKKLLTQSIDDVLSKHKDTLKEILNENLELLDQSKASYSDKELFAKLSDNQKDYNKKLKQAKSAEKEYRKMLEILKK